MGEGVLHRRVHDPRQMMTTNVTERDTVATMCHGARANLFQNGIAKKSRPLERQA
jgi:protein-tyrosine-phosphatase